MALIFLMGIVSAIVIPIVTIIFECHLDAAGTERQVEQGLLHFLSGIEAPQSGAFGEKEAVINDIKNYFVKYNKLSAKNAKNRK